MRNVNVVNGILSLPYNFFLEEIGGGFGRPGHLLATRLLFSRTNWWQSEAFDDNWTDMFLFSAYNSTLGHSNNLDDAVKVADCIPCPS